MAYDNPRPSSQPVGSIDLAVAKDDLITLDLMVTAESGTEITNRKGQKLTPLVDVVDGANSIIADELNRAPFQIVGDFADGFQIDYRSQVGQAADGTVWRWTGALPHTVTAGTTPTPPDFIQLFDTDHDLLTNLDGRGHGAIHRIETTVAEVATGKYQVDDKLILADRAGAKFNVVSGGTANGFDVLDAGNGNTAALVIKTTNRVSEFGVTDSVESTSALKRAIEASNSLDLEGLNILATPFSVVKEHYNIFSSKKCAKITNVSTTSIEYMIKLTTTTADSCVYLDDFTVDAAGYAAKALFVENSVTGNEMFLNNVGAENATQEATTGLAAGICLFGGFKYVEMNSPRVKDSQSNGGSLIASGIRTGQNGSAVSERIVVNNPQINGVRPGNDGDGVVLLQDYPRSALGYYEVNGGKFENCHKRAIKTQCWKTVVREPLIVRTEIHQVFGGNVDIDIQHGNGEVINPTFDYSTGQTFPANGMVTLNPERGNKTAGVGRSTNVIGGTCTIRDSAVRPTYLFAVGSFEVDDIINRPSVRGFKFNGAAKSVCQIRPLASTTFNKELLFGLVFKDCTFEDIDTSFFRLDRSGTGYAYSKDVSVIDCSVLSSNNVQLSENISTQVGITYNLLKRNDNINDGSATYYTHRASGIADIDAYSHTFKIPLHSAAEITATYSSGAGKSYHAHRTSIVQCGNGAAESQEWNWHDEPNLAGSFTISSALVGGAWEITIDKPIGASAVSGAVEIVVRCAAGVTM